MPVEVVKPGNSIAKEILLVGCFGLALLAAIAAIVIGLFLLIPQLAGRGAECVPAVGEGIVEAGEADSDRAAKEIESGPAGEEESSPVERMFKPEPESARAERQSPKQISLKHGLSDVSACGKVAVRVSDIMGVEFVTENVTQDIEIFVPSGLELKGVSATGTYGFVVYESLLIVVPEGAVPRSTRLKTVGLDHTSFFNDPEGAELSVVGVTSDKALQRFLDCAAGRRASWNIVQSGTWVIRGDITAEQLGKCRLMMPDTSSPDGYSSRPVATASDIQAVADLLVSAGLSPEDYRLFSRASAKRDRLLEAVDYSDPAADYIQILEGKGLAAYKGDSEIEQLLRRYLTQHRRFKVRRLALENLMELGSSEESDSLIRRAFHGDEYSRFLIAYELYNRGDGRSWPLLAIWCDDPMMGRYCRSSLSNTISIRTGEERQTGETVYEYWLRTVGWDKSGFKENELPRARSYVDKQLAQEDGLGEALGDLVSDNAEKAYRAASSLRRFSRNAAAFDALCRTAATHEQDRVRKQAMHSLQSFRDFNPGDTCLHAIANDSDAIVFAAVALAGYVQFDGCEDVLDAAMDHPSAYVRRNALQAAGSGGFNELEAKIVRIARNDSDRYVREEAEQTLARIKSLESVRIALKLLASSESADKRRGFEYLRCWGDDKRALDLIEPYADDPHIGDRVTQHLRKHR